MKTIWKFPLEITDKQTIEMPVDTEILTIQAQNDQLCIWAMVNPDIPHKRPHTFEIIGTGHPIPTCERKYLGSCQTRGGALVWHVFEVVE